MTAFFLSFYLLATPSIADSAAQSMKFIEDDIKPVITYAMDWSMKAGMAITSVHAFVVLCKRFID